MPGRMSTPTSFLMLAELQDLAAFEGLHPSTPSRIRLGPMRL
jgi:hypothetical protein